MSAEKAPKVKGTLHYIECRTTEYTPTTSKVPNRFLYVAAMRVASEEQDAKSKAANPKWKPRSPRYFTWKMPESLTPGPKAWSFVPQKGCENQDWFDLVYLLFGGKFSEQWIASKAFSEIHAFIEANWRHPDFLTNIAGALNESYMMMQFKADYSFANAAPEKIGMFLTPEEIEMTRVRVQEQVDMYWNCVTKGTQAAKMKNMAAMFKTTTQVQVASMAATLSDELDELDELERICDELILLD